MNHTRNERLAMAVALREAKPLLSLDGRDYTRHEFICNALRQLARVNPGHALGAALAEELIEWRLRDHSDSSGGRRTFCTWLRDQGVPKDEIWWPRTTGSATGATPKTQARRLAWMDLLIAELEAA